MTTVTPLGAVQAATTTQVLDAFAVSSEPFRRFVTLLAVGMLLRRLPPDAEPLVTVERVEAMLDDPALRDAWIDLFDGGGIIDPHGHLARTLRRIRL
jgi:hypothetical protein